MSRLPVMGVVATTQADFLSLSFLFKFPCSIAARLIESGLYLKRTAFLNTYGFNSFAITGTTISSFGLSFGSW
ncbi:hypothetical protein BpHYR1_008472 [Brachionus plicatilis]|uniref:Uncharacterized protein n=1 Tax=Brachionus plicatilis TaxID=10195 RepID=A0A3M7SA75_BRAPC|nr:hypothetical protein BpHYR1_008472 [Brachionus plicatilis]